VIKPLPGAIPSAPRARRQKTLKGKADRGGTPIQSPRRGPVR